MKKCLKHLPSAIASILLAANALTASPFAFAGGIGATIGGGVGNTATGDYSTVAGGNQNAANGFNSTIGGGYVNDTEGFYSTIGGGSTNKADDDYSTVAGGAHNTAHGQDSVVGGGYSNTAFGYESAVAGGFANFAADYGFIGGGRGNYAHGSDSAVAGGQGNDASGSNSFVAGGYSNTAGGDYSFAGGKGALVRTASLANKPGGDAGSFVWNDGQKSTLSSYGPRQFIVGANGGFGVNTAPVDQNVAVTIAATAANPNYSSVFLRGATTSEGMLISSGDVNPNLGASFYVDQYNGFGHARRLSLNPGGELTITNQAYKPGGGSWAASSDARLKTNVQPLGHALDRMLALKGVTFEYAHPDGGMHPTGSFSGFIAQDVEKVFPNWIGHDNDGYLTVGPQGFEAITVEALRELKTSQDERVARLERDNAGLRELVVNQTKAISDLRRDVAAMTNVAELQRRRVAATAK